MFKAIEVTVDKVKPVINLVDFNAVNYKVPQLRFTFTCSDEDYDLLTQKEVYGYMVTDEKTAANGKPLCYVGPVTKIQGTVVIADQIEIWNDFKDNDMPSEKYATYVPEDTNTTDILLDKVSDVQTVTYAQCKGDKTGLKDYVIRASDGIELRRFLITLSPGEKIKLLHN